MSVGIRKWRHGSEILLRTDRHRLRFLQCYDARLKPIQLPRGGENMRSSKQLDHANVLNPSPPTRLAYAS
jgi:hypothetical protein